MDPTAASRKYGKQIDGEKLKWKLNTDKIRQALVESLCENKQTKLMAMEFQKLPRTCDEAFVKSVLFKTYQDNFTLCPINNKQVYASLSTMYSERLSSRWIYYSLQSQYI
jgi:vancomycin resistance protein YoaR